MGLLGRLVLLPLAPVNGVIWLAEQIERQAVEQFESPAAIQERLEELDQRLRHHEITEDEHRAAEDEILSRLQPGHWADPHDSDAWIWSSEEPTQGGSE